MRLITLILLLLTACGKSPNPVQGPQGAPGTNGTNGVNGVDATPVTVVPLCPGFVPSYPNVFPEYGLCIGTTLYGVYSANGGFLAELPPGTYSSNGINASCNLTVKPNCEVI